MQVAVLTLFPALFEPFFQESLLGKGVEAGLLSYTVINIRDFTEDKHFKVDDVPYGGGAGMVLSPQPLHDALEAAHGHFGARGHVVFLSPQGKPFNHQKAVEFSRLERPLILLCGRYEGVDERIRERHVDEHVSLGDFVLNGGELAAMAVIEASSRFVPGMMGNAGSLTEESHAAGLLEYPQYTRPSNFMGMEVPPVLLSGHHKNIAQWRRRQSLIRTRAMRPDLFEAAKLTQEDYDLLEEE